MQGVCAVAKKREITFKFCELYLVAFLGSVDAIHKEILAAINRLEVNLKLGFWSLRIVVATGRSEDQN
jgi:hypothetical protein